MFATFVVLVFWGYVRFTGNYSEVGTAIDNASYALHTNVRAVNSTRVLYHALALFLYSYHVFLYELQRVLVLISY